MARLYIDQSGEATLILDPQLGEIINELSQALFSLFRWCVGANRGEISDEIRNWAVSKCSLVRRGIASTYSNIGGEARYEFRDETGFTYPCFSAYTQRAAAFAAQCTKSFFDRSKRRFARDKNRGEYSRPISRCPLWLPLHELESAYHARHATQVSQLSASRLEGPL